MNRKKTIIYSLLSVLIIIILIIGLTYGYTGSKIYGNTTNSDSVVVDLKNSSVEFTDLSSNDKNELIEPGFSDVKLFTVKNLGNVSVSYNIYLTDVVNTFTRRNDLTYKLYRKGGENSIDTTTSGATVVSEGVFPSEDIYLRSGETLAENGIYTCAFKVDYLNSQENQDVNKGAVFQSKIEINDTIDNPFESGTLAYKILDNAINVTSEQKTLGYAEFKVFPPTRPGYAYPGSDERLLSITSDESGNSYYFRGNVKNNYINFAGMCWRIMHIEGDGSQTNPYTTTVIESE